MRLWRLVAASPGCGGGRSGTDHKVGSGQGPLDATARADRAAVVLEGNRGEGKEDPRRRRASDCRGGGGGLVGAARAALMSSNKDAIGG